MRLAKSRGAYATPLAIALVVCGSRTVTADQPPDLSEFRTVATAKTACRKSGSSGSVASTTPSPSGMKNAGERVMPITADGDLAAIAADVTTRLSDGLAKIDNVRVVAPQAAVHEASAPLPLAVDGDLAVATALFEAEVAAVKHDLCVVIQDARPGDRNVVPERSADRGHRLVDAVQAYALGREALQGGHWSDHS